MEEFNDLFNLEEINEVLDNKNRDPYVKEVGDRVSIIDFSSTTHMNGLELDPEMDEEMSFNSMTLNPITNKQYRINSGHVTLK